MGKVKDEQVYEIDEILKKKIQKKKTFYLIKWKNYGDEDNSWSEAKDVSKDAIKEFEAKQNKAIKALKPEAGKSAPEDESPENYGTPVEIIAATDETPNRQIAYRVKFSDGKIKAIEREIVTQHWPQIVIKFLEKHIKFEPKEISIPLL